jgi:hypothetical protein
LSNGGAWLFAVGSLIPLLWLIAEAGGDWSGTSRVFGASVNGQQHGAWGLSYSGTAGMLLIFTQLLVTIAAIVLSVIPGDGRRQRLRRIGLGWLALWSAWWTLGLIQLSLIAPGFFTIQALFVGLLCACSIHRAMKNWSPPSPSTREPLLTIDDVPPSRTLREVIPHQGSLSRSTLPPEKITPTRSRFERTRTSSLKAAARATALLGSMMSFIRSQTRRIASTMRASGTVTTRST